MKKIFLESIELQNFMGLKSKKVKLDQDINFITGANATGKTTLNTAFRWLLFGKDVNDRSDFELKTIDSSGKVINYLEHIVKAKLKIIDTAEQGEDKEIELQKVYKEIWRKKKGAEQPTFSGHETLYYIDDVPMLKKDYEKKLDEIITESSFKILTDPLYFSEKLHWKDQRNILLEVCGEIAEEDIFAENDQLKKLDLKGKTIEDFRKSESAKRKKLNEELERIPTRIDEVEKSKRNENFEEIYSERQECNRELEEIELLLKKEVIDDPLKDKKIRLEELKREIESKLSESKYLFDKEQRDLRYKYQAAADEIKSKTSEVIAIRDKIKRTSEAMQEQEQILIDLRREWNEVNEQEFKADIETSCPTCGQEIPEKDLLEKVDELKAKFNMQKAEKLDKINQEGKRISENKWESEKWITESNKKAAEIEDEINILQKEQKALNEFLIQDYKEPLLLQPLRAEAEFLENDILSANLEDEAAKQRILNLARKKQLQKEIENLDSVLTYADYNKKANERIEELKTQQKEIAQKIANIEKQEYLSDEYIKTKVKLLEEKINKKFLNVSFRLFETQVNGSIDEVCKALINGVPFADANRAGKINAGIDIINTLSEYYQVSAPIWIDNRESITDLIRTNAQIINLNVNKVYKEIIVNPTPMDEVRAEEAFSKKYKEPIQKESLFD